jgi:hypothetical protein
LSYLKGTPVLNVEAMGIAKTGYGAYRDGRQLLNHQMLLQP